MRIIRVAERIAPLPGGEEIHVVELTTRQVAAGHQVALLYRAGSAPHCGAIQRELTGSGWSGSIHGLPGTVTFGGSAASWIMKYGTSDIVHIHGDFTDALFPAIAARRIGAKTVMTVHAALNYRYKPLASRVYAKIDSFIALGDVVANDLARHGVESSRITTMSSGLNEAILDEARQIQRVPGRIAAVGSLIPMKDISTLIEAFMMLPPGLNASLDIVGDGPQRSRLEAQARANNRIRFMGQLPRSGVYRVLGEAQIFAMCSRRLPGKGEGVPTALLEAMALGKDCIVSNDALPTPVVTDTHSYRVFPAGNAGALARLLEQSIRNPEESLNCGLRATAAVSHLGWGRVSTRIEAIYDEILGTAQGEGPAA